MGRKRKWKTKSHNVMSAQLRKTINSNTNKPWTDYQIMEKFGYFDEDKKQIEDFNNAIKGGSTKNGDEEKRQDCQTDTENIKINSEFIEQLLVRAYIRSNNIPSKELRAHMMDFWKTNYKVPDETNFDEQIDLRGLIDVGIKHHTGVPKGNQHHTQAEDVKKRKRKAKKAGNEQHKVAVSDQ